MRNRIWMMWEKLLALLSDVRKRIDQFWQKEDELYWADPAAYCRRTDWFWTKVSMTLVFSLILIVCLEYA
jgi:hypothetical protein